jgi:tetratricopeptide (TPR) repeat protein
MADALDAAEAGFLARALVRNALSVALVTPWLGAALALGGGGGPTSRWQAAAAVVLATVPPGVYAERLVQVRSANLETFASTGRLVSARGILDGLIDLTGDRTAAERRQRLDQDIDAVAKSVARELSSTAPASARLTRAFAFIQLDRPVEAEAILLPLAESDPTAGLLLGAVHRDRERWTDAERTYQRVLDVLLPQADRDPRAADGCVTAYDGLAEARRSLDRPGDAARAYHEALDRLAGKGAYFHLQIGIHEANQGRSAAALGHFAEAVRLDPRLEPQAAPHARRLRVNTPSCFTPRPPNRP